MRDEGSGQWGGARHRYTKNGIGNANRKLQELRADHVRFGNKMASISN